MSKARSSSLRRLFRLGHRRFAANAALIGCIMILAGSASADLQAQTLTTLASFNGSNGAWPVGALMLVGSTLYGVARAGGANGNGDVFSVPMTGGTATAIANFNDSDGSGPTGGLVASGNTLYGLMNEGGDLSVAGAQAVAQSSVFPLAAALLRCLPRLAPTSGFAPSEGLTLDGTTLYGTAVHGGDAYGTVFSVPLTGGTVSALASFNGKKDAPRPFPP